MKDIQLHSHILHINAIEADFGEKCDPRGANCYVSGQEGMRQGTQPTRSNLLEEFEADPHGAMKTKFLDHWKLPCSGSWLPRKIE